MSRCKNCTDKAEFVVIKNDDGLFLAEYLNPDLQEDYKIVGKITNFTNLLFGGEKRHNHEVHEQFTHDKDNDLKHYHVYGIAPCLTNKIKSDL